jgi:hypothetical protein
MLQACINCCCKLWKPKSAVPEQYGHRIVLQKQYYHTVKLFPVTSLRVVTYRRDVSALNIVAEVSSRSLALIYQTTRRHISDNGAFVINQNAGMLMCLPSLQMAMHSDTCDVEKPWSEAFRSYCSHSVPYSVRPDGYCMYRQFNIKQFHVLPAQCIYVFCVDLRTNSGYFPIQH